MIEAKEDYSKFVNKSTGSYYRWFSGSASIVSQANRQLLAANGVKIHWYFNDQLSLNATSKLFKLQNITGIDLILKPTI